MAQAHAAVAQGQLSRDTYDMWREAQHVARPGHPLPPSSSTLIARFERWQEVRDAIDRDDRDDD